MQLTEKTMKVSAFSEIRENLSSGSKALHATVEFQSGQIVSKFRSKSIFEAPNYLTVQVGEGKHIMLEPDFLQYINHSCEPNVEFNPSLGTVRAIRKISIGEELTFFYPSTEWSMAQGFDCLCNSEKCLGYIQGAAHLPINILEDYKFSQYIQQMIKSRLDKSVSM